MANTKWLYFGIGSLKIFEFAGIQKWASKGIFIILRPQIAALVSRNKLNWA